MKNDERLSYSAAIEFLHGLQIFGANFGLETTRNLAAFVANPQEKLSFIHVAGTNGKGSTCAMLEGIYRAAGLRMGLFTSPHLVSFRERIQVNRHLISEKEVARLVAEICDQLKTFSADQRPTFFEVITVMALKYFAEQKCDLVIWEAGLGGRLDATNIVTPLASVITNIAFDHQQWLGDTLAKIALEKAGIIKPGVPIITSASEPEVLRVINETAREANAPLSLVLADAGAGRSAFRWSGGVFNPSQHRLKAELEKLPLLGEHQQLNAALAIATVEILKKQIPVSDEQIRSGLAQLNWSGRLQVVRRVDGQTVLLDGAHNVAGVESLRAALVKFFPSTHPTLLLGVLGDKDWSAMCEILAPLAARILLMPVNSPRTMAAGGLERVCRMANPRAEILVCGSLKAALKRAAQDSFVVITGSLYLVGEALELLGLEAGQTTGERGLNEWTGKTSSR